MKESIFLGTYNIPLLTNDSLTASFTAPGIASREMMEKLSLISNEETPKQAPAFDKIVKGVVSVPKPKK